MVRSTSCSTCTAPKLLLMPRSCSSGSAMGPPRAPGRGGRRPGAVWHRGSTRGGSVSDRSGDAGLGAQAGEAARADLGLLDGAVRDGLRHVLLVDEDGVEQHRGDVALAGLVPDRAGGLTLLPGGQRERQLDQRVDLLLGGLVDRHALRAVEDVLQALGGGVLAGHWDLARDVVLAQDRDRGVAETVVGGQDTVDLAACLGVHLLEDGGGALVVPVGNSLLGNLLVVGLRV